MGVMLVLDRSQRSRGHGQHARKADDQQCVDALTVFLPYRRLGRLARTVLGGTAPGGTVSARTVPGWRRYGGL